MKKIFFIPVLILLTGLILSGTGNVIAESTTPRIILYTSYRQMGWGDRVQIGSVDDLGVVRLLTGNDAKLKWPYKPQEQLDYLSQTDLFTEKYTLTHDDLFALKSLVFGAEDQGSKSVPAADDAGTEKSYAVRYSKEGEPTFILLGMSGDDMFENSDPTAQALYRMLRVLFPEVTTYAYDSLGMGPQGFTPVPLAEFLELDMNAVMNAEIRGYLSDCEAGPIPLELTAEDKAGLISLIENGIVTGKADCIVSTGGFNDYNFFDAAGNWIGSVSFEDGLLIKGDGHYYFEIR
ncbi:MAG: hypothetical protein IJI57_12835 [Flexilinea sp.]|nr:hypothetical protein [Flexilinea sp.]